MSIYRLIRLPRVGIYLAAHWFEEDSVLFIVPQFTRFSDILELAKILDANGFKPFPIYTDTGEEVTDLSNPPDAPFYDFIGMLEEETDDVTAIWDAGEEISDEEAFQVFNTLAEVIR